MTFTPAERSRRYRSKRSASGKPASRGKHKSLFDAGEFIAIDGEGFSEGEELHWHVGVNDTHYTGKTHSYAYLSASTGDEIYNPTGRLSTGDCLDFLFKIKSENKHAILVCFGASYDFTQILAFGVERDDLRLLMQGDGRKFSRRHLDITIGQHDYRIECRMRKSLNVSRWPAGAAKYERHRKRDGSQDWRRTACETVTLWDVWGFFQGSFLAAIANWLPQDADYAFIKEWKGKRSGFQRSELDTIRRYNDAELRCLVSMMNKVREAVAGMGLKISRWDGAGAIAGAMFKLHNVKEHMAASPPAVFDAACHAYSGGHIEIFKLGHYSGKVYHYDINSAYPHQFRSLPSLANGVWHSGVECPPVGFTLVRVRYAFRYNQPFYPFFYRESNGTILYPRRGEGWYWFPEYLAAQHYYQKFGGTEFTVIEWHSLAGGDNQRPFAWVETYYERRKHLVAEVKRTGVPNGEEKMLKLGYNSCYGKTAQQVGARYENGEIKAPPYFQIEWAGYVTAGCRAQIMDAAITEPDKIISVATDGIFATTPLSVNVPSDKQLGAWDAQQHDGMTIVMPGVYWLHDAGKTKHYSRGFNREDMEEIAPILSAWSKGADHLDVKMQRLITLGSAITSDSFWDMRGMFVSFVKELRINGDNSKRYPLTSLRSLKPHKQLVDTYPRDLWERDDEDVMSAPYSISWLELDEIENEDRSLNNDVLAAFLA